MEELIGAVAAVWPLPLSITVLIVSIWASQQVNPKRDSDISQRANRREAATCEEQFERERVAHEAAIQALIDRSGRRFEALLVRSDELAGSWRKLTRGQRTTIPA